MKQICSVSDIARLGTILCLGAHPDDETFMAGGLLAAAVKNGQKVLCVTATKGEQGIQDEQRWPGDKLASIREIELKNALELLGVQQHYLLPYMDGKCAEVDTDAAIDALRPIFDEHEPDTVLTFGPDGLTGHPDHIAMSHWINEVVKNTRHKPVVFHSVIPKDLYDEYLLAMDKQLNIFFMIDKPPLKTDQECSIVLQLPQELRLLKCEALRAMQSQTGGLFSRYNDDTICYAWAKEAFVAA